MRYSTIIVGTDGSDSALTAVESGVSQRAPCDVLIVHTVEDGPRDTGSSDATAD